MTTLFTFFSRNVPFYSIYYQILFFLIIATHFAFSFQWYFLILFIYLFIFILLCWNVTFIWLFAFANFIFTFTVMITIASVFLFSLVPILNCFPPFHNWASSISILNHLTIFQKITLVFIVWYLKFFPLFCY